MKIIKLAQNSQEWEALRLGKITGSKLKDVLPNVSLSKDKIVEEVEKLGVPFKKTAKKEELLNLLSQDKKSELEHEAISTADRKIGFYQLVADLVATEKGDENPMERGHRLEKEAIEIFTEHTGLEVDTDIGLCISSENPNIAYSPDGVIIENTKIVEDVEVKCLSSARHLMAFYEQEIPEEYYAQMIQGFIVNPDLRKRYMVFYDPRIIAKPIHWIKMERKDVENDIRLYFECQNYISAEVQKLVTELTF